MLVEYSRDRDSITSADRDARESVREVRVPLVPGIETGPAVLNVEVYSSLQNRVLRGVAIDADPGRRCVLGTAAASRWS